MECPNCGNQLKINQKLSRGMGNQSFQECPVCGLFALVSGESITQTWPAEITEKGEDEDVTFWAVR